jgi:hypothetical protein
MVGQSETWIVVLPFYWLQLAAAEPTHHPGVSVPSGQMTTAQMDWSHALLINGNEMHSYTFLAHPLPYSMATQKPTESTANLKNNIHDSTMAYCFAVNLRFLMKTDENIILYCKVPHFN